MRAWLSWLERRLVAPKITGSNPVVLDGFVCIGKVELCKVKFYLTASACQALLDNTWFCTKKTLSFVFSQIRVVGKTQLSTFLSVCTNFTTACTCTCTTSLCVSSFAWQCIHRFARAQLHAKHSFATCMRFYKALLDTLQNVVLQ